jgi:hypothetical protein
MNDDPEHSEEKRKANIRSLKEMALLLRYPNYLFSLLLDQKLGCDKIIFETWFGIYLSLLIFAFIMWLLPQELGCLDCQLIVLIAIFSAIISFCFLFHVIEAQ